MKKIAIYKYKLVDFVKRFIYKPSLIKNIETLGSVPNTKVDLSICAIIKNEGRYLKEWLEYHLMVGIECFFLYDNESTDNTFEILKPYIDNGIVLYNKIMGGGMQIPVYNDCIIRYGKFSKWLAVIDADEFILPECGNIQRFLEFYEEQPGVCINWVMFDSNGYENSPKDKLVTESYTRVHKDFCEDNMHVKTIVQPRFVKYYVNPHYPLFKFFKEKVNENFEKVHLAWTKPEQYSIKKIRINHYFSKSKEEYIEKIQRGMADSNNFRPYEDFRVNFLDGIYDSSMKKYISELRCRCELL